MQAPRERPARQQRRWLPPRPLRSLGLPARHPAAPGPSGATGTTVGADESEFKIVLAAPNAPAGPVTFAIKNSGALHHQFIVVSTDLKADKLPVKLGTVDESAVTKVGEVEEVAAGANESLSANLTPGHYVVLCNLPGHYIGGMHADLDVK